MSTLAMSEVNQQICDEFDLCEYGYVYLITMSDGYRFVATNLDDAELVKIKASGATINLLSELGV
jgi:hypothetical protein